jgi:hypothetical protein
MNSFRDFIQNELDMTGLPDVADDPLIAVMRRYQQMSDDELLLLSDDLMDDIALWLGRGGRDALIALLAYRDLTNDKDEGGIAV